MTTAALPRVLPPTQIEPLNNNVPSQYFVVPPPFEEGLIAIFTGLRGGSKSSQLARVAMRALSCWHRRVYSDFPIGGTLYNYKGEGRYYEVEPLPNDYFITYGKSVPRGSIIIVDELGEFFNRQQWYTTESQFGTSMAGQIRKLGHWIFGAIQFFHHLNPRINEQVDCLIRCRDLAKSPWGRERHLGKGVEAWLEYFDLSGWVSPTGKIARSPTQPHLITGEPYKREVVYIKAYREFFDTHRLTALERKFQSFKVKKQIIKVTADGKPERDAKPFLAAIINDACARGREMIKAGDLYAAMHADGFNIGYAEIKAKLNQLGLEPRHYESHPEGRGLYYPVKEVST